MNDKFDVPEIALNVEFPSDSLRMVFLHPFIEVDSSEEPFKWIASKKANQIAAIERTLVIAKQAEAHFTVMPEYSIPGLEGVEKINSAIIAEDWPSNSILIAGIDGLSQEEYKIIWETLTPDQTISGTEPANVSNDLWVNCCVLWVKAKNNQVLRFIQPKLSRARGERNTPHQRMFEGNGAFLFRANYGNQGYPCRFFTLICFDWIAQGSNGKIVNQLLFQINEQWRSGGEPKGLNWVFIPQWNDNPKHLTFLNATRDFLLSTANPFVLRHDTAVVLINSAAQEYCCGRSSRFGFSGLVFNQSVRFDCDVCSPTCCLRPRTLRGFDALSPLCDIVFREMGAVIHSFSVHVPHSIHWDVSGRPQPLENATTYSLTGNEADPRRAGREVPACVKWTCDCLDVIDSTRVLGQNPIHPQLVNQAAYHQNALSLNLRTMQSQELEQNIVLASCPVKLQSQDGNEQLRNPDTWSTAEEGALETLLHGSTIVAMGSQFAYRDSTLHGRGKIGEKVFDLAIVRGNNHSECIDHFYLKCGQLPNHKVLLVTRDQENGRNYDSRESQDVTAPPRELGAEQMFTDTRSLVESVSFQELRDSFFSAHSIGDIERMLDGFI